jgi:hypothetical protein
MRDGGTLRQSRSGMDGAVLRLGNQEGRRLNCSRSREPGTNVRRK